MCGNVAYSGGIEHGVKGAGGFLGIRLRDDIGDGVRLAEECLRRDGSIAEKLPGTRDDLKVTPNVFSDEGDVRYIEFTAAIGGTSQ